MTNHKKGFFVRLDQFERNVLQLEAEEKGITMSQVLKSKLREDKIKKAYTLTIQNTESGELKVKDTNLDRYTAELMRENIGTITRDPNGSGEWILKNIVLKIDKQTEPTNDVMSKVLSKMYKRNPLN